MAHETVRAVGFLSRIPVPSRFFGTGDAPLAAMVRGFPLAGVVVAFAPAVLLAILAAAGAPALLAAFVALALQTAVTGALHEDGLADTADGLGASKRERALEIMHDSRNGTFGTLALMFSLALRGAALGALAASTGAVSAGFVMIGIAAASRAAMVWHWQALAPARGDGVAAASGQPDERQTNWAIGIGVAIFVLVVLPGTGATACTAALASIAIATGVLTRRLDRFLGGHTGDTIGATQQVAEIAGLVTLAIFA
ncbi:adenosylcobinamide-GDP ribazoletransferase [Pararhizobium mangrovi]|uniref:Adenosylcobinamide-GDP ribazoletransferase n=1 Tax=Pararhizobium mangrovi TaxID=2590452 RepID=A0A506UAI7_9HYPH|nr:adenosylcobinamide-GDP ribazoletransferase [Pararhizobium mangrovi]TPW31383.1 adenosylcobinamide-GDP ribazoletransferase [Pararhizobium mangrovi]